MIRSTAAILLASITFTGSAQALEVKPNSSAEMIAKAAGILKPAAPATPPAGALPDTVIAQGTKQIRRAWLTRPTVRYGHAVLGDAIEAGGVAAELTDGAIAELALDHDSVFEDRVPRLVDMNGDGRDEILVVRSYLNAGAALAVVEVAGTELRIAAMASPIGIPNRWLNPAGAADFDGDGRMEAAVVITPHIGGTLQLYEWRGDRLMEDHSKHGFSNHAMGARELGLSAVTDLNGDGVPDLVLPDAARSELIGLTFAGGNFRELFRHRLEGRMSTALRAADLDGDGRAEIFYGTASGTTVLSVRP